MNSSLIVMPFPPSFDRCGLHCRMDSLLVQGLHIEFLITYSLKLLLLVDTCTNTFVSLFVNTMPTVYGLY